MPRSPYDMMGGLVYFPRMFEKLRLHARGDLPEEYHNNLARELDGYCLAFLHVKYANLRERVLTGGSDEQILEGCLANGRRPGEGESEILTASCKRLAGATSPASALPPGFSSRPSDGLSGGAGHASISSNWRKAARRPISGNGNCPEAIGLLVTLEARAGGEA